MRFGRVAAIMVGALMLVGRNAEAQARGTLQATATVVDTRQGFQALSAVRQALTDSRIESHDTVATVSIVSTERPATKPSTVVVTAAFSRNSRTRRWGSANPGRRRSPARCTDI